ncbi:MAG: hypothetical protein R3296_03250 [Oleiphilaceae bacterium]|nr:hypothetical protein [Oleiphilaceae bacterium]
MAGLLLLPLTAMGHGAGFEPVEEESVAVRFAYALGEPMTGAEVKVLPPGSDAPYQVGRADQNGRFAFVPDRPGDWTLMGEDDAGHQVRATVSVSAEGMAVDAPKVLSVPPAWLLGGLLLSLLVNAGLISALLAGRRKSA